MTLKHALEQWRGIAAIGKRPKTQKYHREIVQFILMNWPGDLDKPAESVTYQEASEFVLKIGHLSASRFNGMLTTLRAVVPAARTFKRRKILLKDRALLSQFEFSKLLAELDGRPQSQAGLVIRFLAHTGLRINEARQLTWSDVKEGFILAPGAITKNGRPRVIPFVNGIVETLERLKAIGNGERVLPQSECKRSLQVACERAGLPRLSHHDFRHLFATRCVQSGVDLPTVARWLGHLDGGALLARVYYHLVDDHSRAMASKVRI